MPTLRQLNIKVSGSIYLNFPLLESRTIIAWERCKSMFKASLAEAETEIISFGCSTAQSTSGGDKSLCKGLQSTNKRAAPGADNRFTQNSLYPAIEMENSSRNQAEVKFHFRIAWCVCVIQLPWAGKGLSRHCQVPQSPWTATGCPQENPLKGTWRMEHFGKRLQTVI